MCAVRDMAEGSVVGALISTNHEFEEAPVGTNFSKPHAHRGEDYTIHFLLRGAE